MHKEREREREPSGLQNLKGAATFGLQLIGPIGYTLSVFLKMKCKYATISRIVLYMTYDETITLRHLLFTTNELQCWQVSFATGSAKRA